MKLKQIKVLSAGVGAGALIAMGGMGVAFSDVSTAEPEPAPQATTPPITTGQTSTQCDITRAETAPPGAATTSPAPPTGCVAPSAPSVPVATPAITGAPTS